MNQKHTPDHRSCDYGTENRRRAEILGSPRKLVMFATNPVNDAFDRGID
jgi:hypothetical protein